MKSEKIPGGCSDFPVTEEFETRANRIPRTFQTPKAQQIIPRRKHKNKWGVGGVGWEIPLLSGPGQYSASDMLSGEPLVDSCSAPTLKDLSAKNLGQTV